MQFQAEGANAEINFELANGINYMQSALVCIFSFSYRNNVLSFIAKERKDYNCGYVDPEYNRYYILNKVVEFLLETIVVTAVRLNEVKGRRIPKMLSDISTFKHAGDV